MKSEQVDKNKLDLKYQKGLQELNALLILATTGVLTFLGTFLWKTETAYQVLGLLTTVLIGLICLFWYNRVSNRLEDISKRLEGLK